MADEVKTGVAKLADVGRLGFELLDVVLAEVTEAEFIGVTDGARGEDFGHGEETYVRGAAAGTRDGVFDAVVYGGETVLQPGIGHFSTIPL